MSGHHAVDSGPVKGNLATMPNDTPALTPPDLQQTKPIGLRGEWVESAVTLRLRTRVRELENEVERLNAAIAKGIQTLLDESRPR
jgi:hypothetical protein